MSDGFGKGTRTTCPQCGKRFRRNIPKQIYCGRECAIESARRPQRECPICKEKLPRRSSGRVYCSEECRLVAKQIRERANREKMRDTPKEGRICKHCGKQFTARQYDQVYCGPECSRQERRDREGRLLSKTAFDMTKIRIKEPLAGVLPHMQPKVGRVYEAKRFVGDRGYAYVIPEIGKYGLYVRKDECEEIQKP